LARERTEERAAESGIEFNRFRFQNLRAKNASDMESMANARKLLGHSTESMATEYVRSRIGGKVPPVLLSGYAKREKLQEWRKKSKMAKKIICQ
jgi:tRNA G37 N-methylase TrmD